MERFLYWGLSGSIIILSAISLKGSPQIKAYVQGLGEKRKDEVIFFPY